MQPEDLDILRHMPGAAAHYPRARWGFRNEYLVNRRDIPSLEGLVATGFACAGQPLLQPQHFHATAASCKLAGLSSKQGRIFLVREPEYR